MNDFDLNTLIGKTIKNIKNDFDCTIEITFTDNTTIIFETDAGGYYGEYNIPINYRKDDENA